MQELEDRWTSFVVRHWELMVSANQSLLCRHVLRVVSQRSYQSSNQVTYFTIELCQL